jgi:hypothetical protein
VDTAARRAFARAGGGMLAGEGAELPAVDCGVDQDDVLGVDEPGSAGRTPRTMPAHRLEREDSEGSPDRNGGCRRPGNGTKRARTGKASGYTHR